MMTEIERLQGEMAEQARQDSICFIHNNIENCPLRQCEIIKMLIMHSLKGQGTDITNRNMGSHYCYKERKDAEKL